MASSPALGGDGLLPRYVRILQRRAAVVALAWLAIFAVGIVGVTRVFANLKLQARPRGRQREACCWRHVGMRAHHRATNAALTRR